MEASSLPAALELVAGGGAGLSPEKRAVLGSSLLLLQRDYRFERVWFWGCIQGVRGAYYIAEGLGPDRAAPRSRLYRCGGRAGPHRRSVRGTGTSVGRWDRGGWLRAWGRSEEVGEREGCLALREGASLCPEGPGKAVSSPVLQRPRACVLLVAGSLNCVEWSLLPPVTEEMVMQAKQLKGRFQGDPSFEYEYTEINAEDAERLLEDGKEVNTTKHF